MNAIEMRPAGVDALDRLAALYTASFDEPYSRPAVESLLTGPGAWAAIATLNDGGRARQAGFVIARVMADEGEILSLGVRPDSRGAGVGRAMVDYAQRRARDAGAKALYLEVGEDNPVAIRLYKSAGFSVIGHRRDYYRRSNEHRVAALTMRWTMKKLDNL